MTGTIGDAATGMGIAIQLLVFKVFNAKPTSTVLSRRVERGFSWLVALSPSNMIVYFRDGSTKTILLTVTLREVADPTFYLTRSQYTDTGLTSFGADPITPGAWQGSH